MEYLSYARVSGDEQAERDLSIPAQFKAIRKWAEQNGYEITKEFHDEESAHKTAIKRDGFMEMLAYCRRNKVKMIIVHKLDRFSRNRMESIFYKEQLKRHRIIVKSVTEDFDPSTPHGFLYESIIEVFNEWFIHNLSGETKKGMKENAERGHFNGGTAPYGLVIKPLGPDDSDHKTLDLDDPDKVETVRLIFRLAAEQGMGCTKIAYELNHRKIPSPLLAGWCAGTIRDMLTNPVYVGDLRWRRKLTETPGGKSRKSKDGELIHVRDVFPAIVDRKTFDEVDTLIKSRSFYNHSSPTRSTRYLLSRLIKCATCGANFMGKSYSYKRRDGSTVSHSSYICLSLKNKGRAICDSDPVSMASLDAVVIDLIRDQLCSPDALANLEKLVHERVQERANSGAQDPRALKRKLEDADKRIRLYYKAIGDGLDSAICLAHIKELNEQKAQTERQLEAVADSSLYAALLEDCLSNVRRLATEFGSGFSELPEGSQRKLILHFVEKIVVQDQRNIAITLKVPIDEHASDILCDEQEMNEKKAETPESFFLPAGESRDPGG